jgi:APA family basic amino acid/polyamine antiporter
MSRDGLLPKVFSKVHPRFRTPYVGTILTGLFVATFAAFANIAEVVDLTNIGTLFAFVLVSAGVIFLRRTEPDRPRPFRVPGVPFTPIISILACFYLMLQLPAITWIRFAIWLAVGLVFYFAYGYRNSVLRHGPSRAPAPASPARDGR